MSSHSLTQHPLTVPLGGCPAAFRPATAIAAARTEPAADTPAAAPASGPLPTAFLQRVQKALAWEAQQGYSNVQGQQQRFADFAADSFAALSVHQTSEETHAPGGCGAVAASFRNYHLLSPAQRQQLVQVITQAFKHFFAWPQRNRCSASVHRPI